MANLYEIDYQLRVLEDYMCDPDTGELLDEESFNVKFESGYITKTCYSNFKKGNVKDNFYPIKYNVGFIGYTTTKWDNAKIKEGIDCSEWYKD